MKTCSRCKKEKELTDFPKNKNRLKCYCIICTRDLAKEYYYKNKEKRLSIAKIWKQENKQAISEYMKAYRKENIEKLRD